MNICIVVLFLSSLAVFSSSFRLSTHSFKKNLIVYNADKKASNAGGDLASEIQSPIVSPYDVVSRLQKDIRAVFMSLLISFPMISLAEEAPSPSENIDFIDLDKACRI